MPRKLTRDQKRLLAAAMINEVGTLLEFWTERIENGTYAELRDIPGDLAAAQFARWLQYLPGDSWHFMLPQLDKLDQ